MGISFLFGLMGGAKKLLTSKIFWVSLAVIVLVGAAGYQHRSIVNLELENQSLEMKEQNLRIQLAEGDAARAKLLVDIKRMNGINQTLEDNKVRAESRLEEQRATLSEVLTKIDGLKTPEQVATARQKVRTIMIHSYGCLEAATGKVGTTCKR